jgi:hypothetical protein
MIDPSSEPCSEQSVSVRRGRTGRNRRTTVVLEEALDHLLHDDPTVLAEPLHLGRGEERRLKYGCCMAPGLVIHPHFPARQWWDSLMLLLILFSSIYDPISAAYLGARTTFDWVVDTLFWIGVCTVRVRGRP